MNTHLHDKQHEQQFASKIKQLLDHSSHTLSHTAHERLQLARQAALAQQKPALNAQLRIAGGIGRFFHDVLLPHARTCSAIFAITVGVVGTYYWDNFQQASENEEIDSALLADDLPINAYLDYGFHAWLDQPQNSAE